MYVKIQKDLTDSYLIVEGENVEFSTEKFKVDFKDYFEKYVPCYLTVFLIQLSPFAPAVFVEVGKSKAFSASVNDLPVTFFNAALIKLAFY